MSRLIVLIVIVLGVLAIAQLVRLYELSSKLRDRREEDISNRDNKLNAFLLLAFVVFLFGGYIWLMLTYGYTGMGDAASVHGVGTDWLMSLYFWIVSIVFFVTNTLLFGFAFKYVRKPGVKAYYFPHDNRLELVWTIVPAIVLAIIIILGLKSWNEQTADSSKEAVRIELFSKQFGWTVRLSGKDNKLGLFDYKLTNGNNPLALMTTATIQNAIDSMENGMDGIKWLENKLNDRKIMLIPEERELMETDLDRKERLIRLLYQMKARHDRRLDAQALDDIAFNESDTLYLCEGQEYEFNFRAKDVIHSAYMPHFRVQMNTVPGMTTRMKFIPSVTTDLMREKMHNPKFNYILMCNKICGGAHYKMKLMIVVLSKKDYKKWYNVVSYDGKDPEKIKTSKLFKHTYAVGKPVEIAPATGADSIPTSVDSIPMNAPTIQL